MPTQNDQEKKIEINISKLLARVPNRFLLCVAASRRARQIKDNLHQSGVLEEIPTMPVIEALEEIMTGKVTVTMKGKAQADAEDAEATAQAAPKAVVEEAPKEDKKIREKSKSKSKSLAA